MKAVDPRNSQSLPASRCCRLLSLGVVDYQEAWDLQGKLAEDCHEDSSKAALLLLEHPPTYTLGRGADESNVLAGEESLARLGAKLYHIDRGGDVTFHGPGQLVGYPIISLTGWSLDVHQYLRALEEVLIKVTAHYGLTARRIPSLTGVWVGGEKIASIGIKVSRGITTHGFALNVNTDLTYFDFIFPCGLKDKRVTSLAKLIERPVDMQEVVRVTAERFAGEFGVDL